MSWNGKDRGSVEYHNGVLYFLFSWTSWVKSACLCGSQFFKSENHFELALTFFLLPQVFLMSWNFRHRGSVKYSNGVLFILFSWTSWVKCACIRGSWFFIFENQFQLALFFFSLLQIFFMSGNGKDRRAIKYNSWDLFFLFAWISCIICACLRGWFFFTFENHVQLALNFFFTTPSFFYELEWQRPEIRKIQQWGSIFVLCLD